jgi:hypothetical protein
MGEASNIGQRVRWMVRAVAISKMRLKRLPLRHAKTCGISAGELGEQFAMCTISKSFDLIKN